VRVYSDGYAVTFIELKQFFCGQNEQKEVLTRMYGIILLLGINNSVVAHLRYPRIVVAVAW